MTNRILIITLTLFLAQNISYSQEYEHLTGIATDKKGNPINGCNVMIKGTKIGTVTDTCGKFSIQFNEEQQTILFHCMSYVDLRAFEIELKKTEIKNQLIVFQLGNYRMENPSCTKVDKALKKIKIK